MPTIDQARALAEQMVEIGEHADRKVVALISDMNQPLGLAVGNALEVKEALDTLHGDGPDDFREHCLEVAGHMLCLASVAEDFESARKLAKDKLAEGAALKKFQQLVEAQGGDLSAIEDPSLLPNAPKQKSVIAASDGYIHKQHAGEIGLIAMALGAGRAKKGDPVDHAVGIVLDRKVGDAIEEGDRLFTVHARNEKDAVEAETRLLACTHISTDSVDPLPLFYETITD
jgi:pyrimidine-nucleoside phosphorylase